MPIRLSAIFAALLIQALPASAFDSGWHWIEVTPRDNAMPVRWEVDQGMAKNVVITRTTFAAELYPQDFPNGDPVIRLKGTIKGHAVTASAVYVGTDADPEPYRGTLTIQGDTTRVTLKGAWADGYLGLTHLASAPPKP